mgnify:CR=1 FL=1
MSRRKNRLRFWKRWGRMEEERGALQWVLMNMWWSASKGSTPICGAQTPDGGEPMMIAMALLPEGVDVGTRLRWENLVYEVLD